MKFQMAPNSLFAILLRSRWWVSFALAALLALLAAALLPPAYKLVGALASLPFWALGCVALMRQLSGVSPAQMQQLLDQAAQDSWPVFAGRLEAAWQAEGYSVERVQQPSADFLLRRAGQVTLVQAKRWKAAHHGVEPLRELDKARQSQQADSAAYLAIAPIQEKAQAFADQQRIAVLQGLDLAGLLRKARA